MQIAFHYRAVFFNSVHLSFGGGKVDPEGTTVQELISCFAHVG